MNEGENYQRQAALALLLGIAGLAPLISLGRSTSAKGQEVSYSEFVAEVRASDLAIAHRGEVPDDQAGA